MLEDFSGHEYWSISGDKSRRFQSLERKEYRLGYWRHRQTNQYWHGIRRWPDPHKRSSSQGHVGIGSGSISESDNQQFIRARPNYSPEPPPVDISSAPGDGRANPRQRATTKDPPHIRDRGPEAQAWWKAKCAEVFKDPNKGYRFVYAFISDYMAALACILVFASVGVGIWILSTGRLKSGFGFLITNYMHSNFIWIFLPTFFAGLLHGYWYQLDLWYRQLQLDMGLRQPHPATENLLLGYPCDLPLVITLRALGAGHWRFALTSAMPLVQRVLPVLAGSLFPIDTAISKGHSHIDISDISFKARFGMLCAYLILIPVLAPGLDRRLPLAPVCIADSIVMFDDSTLVRKDALLPRRMDEERWQTKYRLCLEERRYDFGIYSGRYGALHLGIDDVYGYSEGKKGFRFVAPLKPPMRFYRRWLKAAVVWSAGKVGIKRQPTLHPEELEALQRLQTNLQETAETPTPNQRVRASSVERDPLQVNAEASNL